MQLSNTTKNPSQPELLALYALVFFLPLFEAPKNIAVTLYIVFWVLRCIKSNNWGGAWSTLESLSLLLATSAALSIQLGLFESSKGLAAIGDIFSYLLVFIAVSRSRFSQQQISNLFLIITISTLLILLFGYYDYLILHKTEALQLHSVGHVNHSAIYLALSIIICAESLISNRIKNAYLLVPVLLFFWVSIFVMSARGAIIPLLAYFFISVFIKTKSVRKMALMVIAFFAIISITLWQFPGIINKTTGNISSGDYSSMRIELANTAILATKEAPLFGVGLNNFGKITPEKTAAWQKNAPPHQQEWLFHTSHAHSLYFNTLAERGIVGLLALLGILLWLAASLLKSRPRNSDIAEQKTWSIALGAFIMVTMGGVFNTTLHHEHGMLSMIMFGVWLSQRKPPAFKLDS